MKVSKLKLGALAELARRDPNAFAEFVFTDPTGNPWKLQEFHREWNQLISERSRVLIITPHGTGKTSLVSVARVLWEIGKNPNIRVRILCSDDVLAESIIRELKEHIEHNERYKLVFPHVVPAEPWDRSKITVRRDRILKDPTVQAESVLGGSTGGRVDWLVADDVCTYRNTLGQPNLMTQVIEAFENVWLNTVDVSSPHARVIYLNTPWDVRDLTWKLRGNPDWARWERPAIDPNTGELLWPERLSMRVLEERRRTMSQRHFSRGYELKPFAPEERTFSDNAIRTVRRDWLSVDFSVPHIIVGALDPATTGQSVFLTVLVELTGKRRPIDVVVLRGRPPREMAEAIVAAYNRFQHNVIYVENNATQESFLDLIQTAGHAVQLPLEGFFTGKQKADPNVGLPILAASMEAGLWEIPMPCNCGEIDCICHRGHSGHECPSCEWVAELRTHPFSTRSDFIMASWFVETAARKLLTQQDAHEKVESIPHQSIFELTF